MSGCDYFPYRHASNNRLHLGEHTGLHQHQWTSFIGYSRYGKHLLCEWLPYLLISNRGATYYLYLQHEEQGIRCRYSDFLYICIRHLRLNSIPHCHDELKSSPLCLAVLGRHSLLALDIRRYLNCHRYFYDLPSDDKAYTCNSH